jgi:hypothetical protein
MELPVRRVLRKKTEKSIDGKLIKALLDGAPGKKGVGN